MKQINNLIVVEVPKDSERHEIIGNNLRYIPHGGMSVSKPYESLPPGNYEIIGVYSEIRGSFKKLVKVKSAANEYSHTSVTQLLGKHGCLVNLNTQDLLFIKKIK